jgi:hypothetical protein
MKLMIFLLTLYYGPGVIAPGIIVTDNNLPYTAPHHDPRRKSTGQKLRFLVYLWQHPEYLTSTGLRLGTVKEN